MGLTTIRMIFPLIISGFFLLSAQEDVLTSEPVNQPAMEEVPLNMNRVYVDFSQIHEVGGITEFDRKKFINLHSNLRDHDWNREESKLEYLLEELDVYFGRDNGSMGWYMNQAEEDPNRSGYARPEYIKNQGSWVRTSLWGKDTSERHKFDFREDQVIGGLEHPFWLGNSTLPYDGSSGFEISGADATGDFMGRYLNEFYRDEGEPVSNGPRRPLYLEILNEPLYSLVTEGDHRPKEVFEFHNEVAAGIRRNNNDVLIGGYTAAFPYFDEDNFQRWQERMKLFYDVSGENMDFISLHFYDFNKHHYNNGRSFHGPINFKGSRVEATFDMMEYYSIQKFGFIKPFMISEFGGRDHSTEWKDWTPERDWQFMKSISPLMLSFMERPHLILKAIPFIMIKAEWGTTHVPYPWRLLRQAKEARGERGARWVFTELIKIYELWSEVKGTRIYSESANPDILVDAYKQDRKVYLILCNLTMEPQEISLNLTGNQYNPIQSAEVRQLHLVGGKPLLDSYVINPMAQSTFVIDSEATAILTYTLDNPWELTSSRLEQKYYAESYLREIEEEIPVYMNINGLPEAGADSAVLRLSMGRNHNRSKYPEVMFNGVALQVPDNWRGDDQHLRNQFFGMLEIPVPGELLRQDNSIAITFPDQGGHISTLALQVFQVEEN